MDRTEINNARRLLAHDLDGLLQLDQDQLYYLDHLEEVEDPLTDGIDCDSTEHTETSEEDFQLWEQEVDEGPLRAALRDPYSLWKPLSGKSTTALKHDIICLHTMVGTLSGSWSWANRSGNPYWHYGINAQGTIWQCQDLRYRSAANLNGNWRVIPIETSDIGEGVFPSGWSDPLWTQAQLDAIVDIVAWLCIRFNIPPVLVPDTCAGRRGIAYHRQGISPNLRSGCERWSNANGKVCPARRVNQIITYVIPRVRAIVGGNPVEEDMDEGELKTYMRELITQGGDPFRIELGKIMDSRIDDNFAEIRGDFEDLKAEVQKGRAMLVRPVEGGKVYVLDAGRGSLWEVRGWDNANALAVYYGVAVAEGQEAGHVKPFPIPPELFAQIPLSTAPVPPPPPPPA